MSSESGKKEALIESIELRKLNALIEDTDLKVDKKTLDFRKDRFQKYTMTEGDRKGVGEQGARVTLTGEDERLGSQLFKLEGFNSLASDKVALDRSLHDARRRECLDVKYPQQLPTASIIIVYYNEYYSAILRTAHSVVNRSPPEYLKEVILLDDGSNATELGQKMHDYVDRTWPDHIVKIIKSPKRGGLIKAKVEGAKAATGDVIIFLDAHCEATKGWLEPLLHRIKMSRTSVLVPSIDQIGASNLYYFGIPSMTSVGGFSWGLHFTWISQPDIFKKERTSVTDPLKSPTMPGGLLAIGREYFFEIGAYDDKMEIWGGENLEMSFRVWQCGGSVEFMPCSHVGHIFRSTHPYGFPSKTRDYHGLNSKRLAEVWMDEFKRIFYMQRGNLLTEDAGDISERLALRKKLNCKSFRWYLDNVYPEKYIMDEDALAFGQIRNPSTNLCFDTFNADEKHSVKLGLYSCQGPGKSFAEVFFYSKEHKIRREDVCLQSLAIEDEILNLKYCSGSGNEIWNYKKDSKQFVLNKEDFCIDISEVKEGARYATLKKCSNSDTQKWEFEKILGNLDS